MTYRQQDGVNSPLGPREVSGYGAWGATSFSTASPTSPYQTRTSAYPGPQGQGQNQNGQKDAWRELSPPRFLETSGHSPSSMRDIGSPVTPGFRSPHTPHTPHTPGGESELARLTRAADARAQEIAILTSKAEQLSNTYSSLRGSNFAPPTQTHSYRATSPSSPLRGTNASPVRFIKGMRVRAASELTVRKVQAVAVGDLGVVFGPSDDPQLPGGVNVQWDRRRDGGERRINVLPSDIEVCFTTAAHDNHTVVSPLYPRYTSPIHATSPPQVVQHSSPHSSVGSNPRQSPRLGGAGFSPALPENTVPTSPRDYYGYDVDRLPPSAVRSPVRPETAGGSIHSPQPVVRAAQVSSVPYPAVSPAVTSPSAPVIQSRIQSFSQVNAVAVASPEQQQPPAPAPTPTPRSPEAVLSQEEEQQIRELQERRRAAKESCAQEEDKRRVVEEARAAEEGKLALLSQRVREEEERLALLQRRAQSIEKAEQEHCVQSDSSVTPEQRPAQPPLSASLRSVNSRRDNATPVGKKRIHFGEDDIANDVPLSDPPVIKPIPIVNLPNTEFNEIQEFESVVMITPRSNSCTQQEGSAFRERDPFDDSIQMTQSVIIGAQLSKNRNNSFGTNSTGNTTPAVWMSSRKSSVRHNKLAESNRSLLARKGSLGRILSKIAEENIHDDDDDDDDLAEDMDRATIDSESGMIEDEAVWWQVPKVDVDTVTFIHPHHGDPPGATSAPPISSIVTMDVAPDTANKEKSVLRVSFDGVQQHPVSTVTLERTEHGVFLLFPEKTKGPVPDRVVAIPPENMGEIVAGVICLAERANVRQHLNYEYEALANQEAIVQRYLESHGKVPWPFVNNLLPPDYLCEPAGNAAVAAALVAIMHAVYKEKGSMCAIM